MSKETSFLDNAVAVDQLNEREGQFCKDIDTKRHYSSAGKGSYKHKDGTTAILIRHQAGLKAGACGFDVVLVRGNDYLHFETTAEDDAKNGKLNITVGNFDSEKQQKLSYPMDAILDFEKVREILTEKNPNLAKTFSKYAPKDFDDMILDLTYHNMKKEKNNETAFMAAFNKWNGGKGI